MSAIAQVELAPRTVWERFEIAADSSSTLSILGEKDVTRSISSLVEQAGHGGAGLQASGLGPGRRVGAFATTTFDFVLAVLSTFAAGATFVSLPPRPLVADPSAWRARIAQHARKVGLDALLISADAEPVGVGPRELSIERTLSGRRSTRPETSPSDPALIQFSSGTTSDPRAILLSNAALVAQFDGVSERTGPATDRRMLSWLPLFHDLGFVNYLLLPLSRGDEATLIPTSLFLRDPLIWLREISSRRATHSPAPNFAYGLVARRLAAAPPEGLDLASWRNASSGGEVVDAATLERFIRAAEPFGFKASSLVPGYGLAEATCIVSVTYTGRGVRTDIVDRGELGQGRATPTSASERATTIVSTGLPMQGCEVAILRDEGFVGEREVGEILVKAPYVMEGYVNDPEATSAAFLEGWLRTGDLGYLFEGEVYITGRLKDLIVVRGQNLHPEDLERLLIGTPKMRPGAAVALAEGEGRSDAEVLIVAETKATSEHERTACRKEIVRRIWHGTGLSPRVILTQPGAVPKTTSGKLRRREALERVRDGRISDA